jgi:hypothetical protein
MRRPIVFEWANGKRETRDVEAPFPEWWKVVRRTAWKMGDPAPTIAGTVHVFELVVVHNADTLGRAAYYRELVCPVCQGPRRIGTTACDTCAAPAPEASP